MATDLEKLVVQLSADIKGYEREMRKAVGVTNRQSREIENRFLQMKKRVDGIGQNTARSLIAPLSGVGAALGGAELIRMTGVWTDLNSRVEQATGGMGKGAEVMARLGEMATRTYSSIEQTAEGFLGFSTTLSELGVTTDKQLDFVESLNNALVVSGAKGQVAGSVMSALSKAMAGGTLQGDNLNTVIETGGRVAKALADSMGVTTMELRKLGSDGKIGRREMLGLTTQMAKLRDEAAAMPATIQDGFTLLNNALLEYIGRGDEATGISARIADALTLIADNFDTVADAGLQVAAVIAGALVGRSMLGMIRTAATGVGSLVAMTKALAAMRLAGIGASVAFGPVGLVLGSVLAGGALLYADAAQKSEERTSRVTAELERLGLVSKQAADQLDGATESLDKLASDDSRLTMLREMREELEKLQGWASSDSLRGISLRARDMRSRTVTGPIWNRQLGPDDETLRLIDELSERFRKGQVSAAAVIEEMRKIDKIELAGPVRSLIAELNNAVQGVRGYQTYLTSAGENEAFSGQQEALGKIGQILSQLQNESFGPPVVAQVNEIIGALSGMKITGEDAQDALSRIADKHPDAAGYISSISAMLAVLREFIAMDAKAKALASAPDAPSKSVVESYQQYGASRRKGEADAAANEAFIAEQRRRNALSKENLDVEDEVNRLLKERPELQRAQAEMLARENIAAREGRKGGSKGGGGKGKRDRTAYTSEVTDIREAIAALEAEATALNNAQLSLSGYGDVADYAKKRLELLNAAKRQGLAITPQLSAEIDQLAQDYVTAGFAVESARERHEAFQSALSETRSTMEGAFTGLVTGAHSFRDALGQVLSKLAEMAASRAFASIWDGAGGSGSGGGIGGSVGGFVKKLLGFEKGGPTPSGPRNRTVGVVHAGENVWSQADIRRAGGMAVVEAMRRNGGVLPGYANGGIVAGPGAAPSLPSLPRLAARSGEASRPVSITVNVAGANGDQHVIALVQQGVRAGLTSFDKGLPDRINQINTSPRRR